MEIDLRDLNYSNFLNININLFNEIFINYISNILLKS